MSLSILLDFFRLFYFYCQWPDFWFVLGDDDFMAGRNIRRYDFFLVMRVLFRSLAKRVIEQSKTLTALDSYDSWQAVAAARAIPYMPNGLVTAICALSGMSFRSHMAGSLLGKLPSVALEVVVGHDVSPSGRTFFASDYHYYCCFRRVWSRMVVYEKRKNREGYINLF